MVGVAEGRRVLIDARVGWGAGIGRYIVNLVPRVARLLPDHRFTMLVEADDGERARATAEGVANLTVQATDIAAFSLAEQTRMPALAVDHDLTWFTNYWVPLRWRGPFVVTIHDLLHLEPALFPASRVKRRLSRLTFGKVRRDAAAVMFDSRFSRRVFEDRIGSARHMSVVHLGGDHVGWEGFAPDVATRKSKRLLVVAAAKKHKNFAMVVDAWRASQVDEGWTLTIVTPNERLRSSVDVGELTSDAGRVDYRQAVSNEELRALYADSALVLVPSLYEGFGFPLLEGLQAGAFCISSTAGSLVEVAEGSLGWFVAGDDRPGWTAAIERACAAIDAGDIDLAALARHNMAVAGRYRWDDTAARTAAVIAAELAGIDASRA